MTDFKEALNVIKEAREAFVNDIVFAKSVADNKFNYDIAVWKEDNCYGEDSTYSATIKFKINDEEYKVETEVKENPNNNMSGIVYKVKEDIIKKFSDELEVHVVQSMLNSITGG